MDSHPYDTVCHNSTRHDTPSPGRGESNESKVARGLSQHTKSVQNEF
jgi:hypothetical protein